MEELPSDVEGTFLTERQAEVLAFRNEGFTQREIAEELGTTVSNISGIERAARDNVEAARHTLDLSVVLESAVWFPVEAETDLRVLIDEIYARGDAAGLQITHAEPELTGLLHDRLRDRLEGRRLTEPVRVGITAAGEVVTFPSADRTPAHHQ